MRAMRSIRTQCQDAELLGFKGVGRKNPREHLYPNSVLCASQIPSKPIAVGTLL